MNGDLKRETIVLVAGMACDERLWEHQVRRLSVYAECLIILPVGHETVEALAADVLAKAPTTFALAGLSLGGYIALEITRIAPERVTRLALLDTTFLADTDERRASRATLVAAVRQGSYETIFEEKVLPRLIAESSAADPRIFETVKDMAQRIGPDNFAIQNLAATTRRDYSDELGRITCDTVIICGRQDVICPLADHEAMARSIPGARLVVIEDCGHLATVEQPEAVTVALESLLR